MRQAAAMADEETSLDEPFHGMTPKSWVDIDSGDAASFFIALDVMNQFPALRRLKTWALERLAPQPGDVAVDVGCGSGEDTRDLALLVQPGEAVGVDISEAMVAEATRRAEAFSSEARFKLASTYELPFKDAEVDVLRCERVIQHLAEPERAVQEMFRVIRPGGRIALIDTDWRTIGIWPGERGITSAVVDAWVDQTVNPAAGSQLADLLISAGFANVTLQPDVLLMQLRDAPDRPPMSLWIDTALKSGKVSPADIDQLRTQLRDAAKTQRCVTSVLVIAAQAERPAA
jgi:ubiquinone/menaquinone biosynthesis C-methylase UbiE